ncbi:hypothetical protein FOS14_00675 [Skermania sp. ID1734]|uniref:hypothetical protein n=1 Tax=Skermania sp. ID1734 TaxID=2597516 RepID=UPI001180ACE0|nr:hypothetical protein [Skermania sp. ID1734]TSE01942.1 hypothetical protein FOS14_00675 [Skermania sp. ID1734]
MTLSGFVSFILEVLFLPLYLGPVPFPITALAAGLWNVVLILTALNVTRQLRLLALPVVGWLVGFVIAIMRGPGGDVVLPAQWQTLLMLVVGVAPAGLVLYWLAVRHTPH